LAQRCSAALRKRADQVTDRALRYRANACPPPGARICCLCGSQRRVEVGHVDGHEENGAPQNLIWTCRACNVRCANVLRRAGLGRLTRQRNPSAPYQARNAGASTLGAWMNAVTSLRGEGGTTGVPEAIALIQATPPERRSEFARQVWNTRRNRYGPTGRKDSPPF
jgi:hypothetical protein